MHVEDGVGKCLEQRRADEAHESGKTDEPYVPNAEFFGQLTVVRVARWRRAVIEDESLDSGAFGAEKTWRVRLV